MSYNSHFQDTDSAIDYLNEIRHEFHASFEKKLAGLICVMAVTSYELAIKEIFIEFAQKEYKPCSRFIDSYFNRLNGRIQIKDIKGQYISYFGDNYKEAFKKRLDEIPQNIRDSYNELIDWRHDFAHNGIIASERPKVVNAYENGKEIIHCLAECMGIIVQSPSPDSDLENEIPKNYGRTEPSRNPEGINGY